VKRTIPRCPGGRRPHPSPLAVRFRDRGQFRPKWGCRVPLLACASRPRSRRRRQGAVLARA
jgi:hypothetical protein